MLSQVQEETLKDLVDKYENRKDYASAEKSPRRTFLKVNSRNYPDYFHDSDSSYRLMFNQEMQLLHQYGYVNLEWEPFNEGQFLKRVLLRTEALAKIYNLLNRTPKKELYRSTACLMEKWSRHAPPELQPFYQHILSRLNQLQPLPAALKPGHEKEIEHLLKGLHAFFETRKTEISKRLLSVRLYGDSKRWEALEKNIIYLLRNFCLPGKEALGDDKDILAERGIVDNPVHINLAGPLVFSTTRGRVDVTNFYPDVGLPPEMAADLTVKACQAEAVVTVEYKASFYHYVREGPSNHLVLYLGGYHNSPRRKLLQKVYKYLINHGQEAKFYHWGDMDLGGINIWYTLKEKTGIPFQPIYMDVDTYREYLNMGQAVNEEYCRKLELLLKEPELEVFYPLIREMVHHRLRIEQEAVNINRD